MVFCIYNMNNFIIVSSPWSPFKDICSPWIQKQEWIWYLVAVYTDCNSMKTKPLPFAFSQKKSFWSIIWIQITLQIIVFWKLNFTQLPHPFGTTEWSRRGRGFEFKCKTRGKHFTASYITKTFAVDHSEARLNTKDLTDVPVSFPTCERKQGYFNIGETASLPLILYLKRFHLHCLENFLYLNLQ